MSRVTYLTLNIVKKLKTGNKKEKNFITSYRKNFNFTELKA